MGQMDNLLETMAQEVQRLMQVNDEPLRRRTIDKLRDLQYNLETPEETMQRLMHTGLTTASIRISFDLDIFNKLVDADRPVGLTELAETAGADPVLLGRILRHQASLGIIYEEAQDTFTASQTTRNLTNQNIQAAIIFYADVVNPAFAATPSFLAACSYRNPTDLYNTPFSVAWNTKLPLWKWLAEHPEHRKRFDRLMYAQRSSVQDCFSILPMQQEAEVWPAERPFFVDVGGATGQQCIALRNRWPLWNLKIILQDLPSVVKEAQLPVGIDAMGYDFFTEQPIKGAKYYYLRAIMHDHSDESCLEILKNLVEAMNEDSALLLDEIVVPDKNVEWRAYGS